MRTGQIKLLKQIGEVGAKRAAEALSSMISTQVDVNVSDIDVLFKNTFKDSVLAPRVPCFALILELEGKLGGNIYFIMSSAEAKLLGAALLGIAEEEINMDDVMFHSSLKEALNIIAGAYMAVLSEVTGLEVMFSVPDLKLDSHMPLVNSNRADEDETMLIKTALRIQDRNFEGLFLFFPDLPTINIICEGIEKNSNN
jgi:chemotaxis protein CheC